MIESWMINLLVAVVAIAGTYAVLRSRVARLEADYRDHITQSENRVVTIYGVIAENKKMDNFRIDAGFKRLDLIADRVTVVETKAQNHLDLPTAEKKFVSRIELNLHLKNIELTTSNTNEQVKDMVGKLSDLTVLLTDKMLERRQS